MTPEYLSLTGISLLLDHAFGLLLAAAMVLLCISVGDLLLSRRLSEEPPAIAAATMGALGAAAVATLILVSTFAFGVNPWTVFLPLLLALGLAAKHVPIAIELVKRVLREHARLGGRLGVVIGVVIGAAMLVVALGPPTDFDGLMYHLAGPQRFLVDGLVGATEGNSHVSYVGLLHFLYLPLLAAGAPSAPTILGVFIFFGAVTATVATADDLFGEDAARACAPLAWGSALLILTAASPKVDVTAAAVLLLCTVHLLRAWRHPDAAGTQLAIAGALAGVAVGIKHLSVLYLAALVPLGLFVWHAGRHRMQHAGRAVAVGLAAALVTMAPWLAKNQLLFGAPFYPHLTSPQLPAWVEAVAETNGVTVAMPGENPLTMVRAPFSFRRWFFAPSELTPEGNGVFYGASLVFLLVPLAFVGTRRREAVALLAPSLLFLGLLVLRAPYLNLRYLAPIYLPLTIAAAAGLSMLLGFARPILLRQALLVLAATYALSTPLSALRQTIKAGNLLPVAMGTSTRWESVMRSPDVAAQVLLAQTVNAEYPPNAKLLLLFDARGYGFERPVIQDNAMRNWLHVRDLTAGGRCLEGSGITHLVFGTSTFRYLVGRGMSLDAIDWSAFPAFATRCLEPVSSNPWYAVFRVKS